MSINVNEFQSRTNNWVNKILQISGRSKRLVQLVLNMELKNKLSTIKTTARDSDQINKQNDPDFVLDLSSYSCSEELNENVSTVFENSHGEETTLNDISNVDNNYNQCKQ